MSQTTRKLVQISTVEAASMGIRSILEWDFAYRMWQAPFRKAKIAPIDLEDVNSARRVLDVACGPGTNADLWQRSDVQYTGLDLNPRYIQYADKKFDGEFLVADARDFQTEDKFDFIFVNSFFHHVSDNDADALLSNLQTLLTSDGHIHIIDLVLPERTSAARCLAKADRGDYPRSEDAWRRLFSDHFSEVVFQPFPVSLLSVPLWQLVYFKGQSNA